MLLILILPEAAVTGRFDARLNMLATLRIKNLALVPDLTLELQSGYTVITGETGAGKSILIGALNLVLGERADRTMIRSGSDSCSVEAIFDVSKLRAPIKTFLEENGLEPCEENQLVLKRTFTNAGANRQFVNGSQRHAVLRAVTTDGRLQQSVIRRHDPESDGLDCVRRNLQLDRAEWIQFDQSESFHSQCHFRQRRRL